MSEKFAVCKCGLLGSPKPLFYQCLSLRLLMFRKLKKCDMQMSILFYVESGEAMITSCKL
jgi:hypothetical protein